jgi:hypothetical protein
LRLSHLPRRKRSPSGVDLTFATDQPQTRDANVRYETPPKASYLPVVLLILTFAKVAAEPGCEC